MKQQKQKETRTIIVDADALIALFNRDDAHAGRAEALLQRLIAEEAVLLYPATALVEATTTLQRKLSRPALAGQLARLIRAEQFPIDPIDAGTLEAAAALFDPGGSKQNTLFDAVVAAVAKRHQADAIFSFDSWYEKAGFRLIGTLFATSSHTAEGGGRAA